MVIIFPFRMKKIIVFICLLHTAFTNEKNNVEEPPRVNSLKIIGQIPVENHQNSSLNILTVECTVSGNPTPSVEWAFNGVKLNNTKRIKIQGGKLTIKNVKGETESKKFDSGRYRCIATNQLGSAFREELLRIPFLGVFANGNKLQDRPMRYLPVVGRSYVIKCPVHVKGYGTTIRWGTVNKNRQVDYWDTGRNPRIFKTLEGDLVYGVVTREDIKESRDVGGVCCILKNGDLKKISNRQMLYQVYDVKKENRYPQLLAKLPRRMEASLGSSYKMICGASGYPAPHYEWEVNGKKLERINLEGSKLNVNGMEFLFKNNMELEIKEVTKSLQEAKFKCSAINTINKRRRYVSSEGTMHVVYPPTVLTPLAKATVVSKGHSVEVQCKASGSPTPTIEWYHNKILIHQNTTDVQLSDNGSTLQFVKLEKSGVYTCVAMNSQGSASQSTFIQIKV